jgi:hypothetical protein
LRFSFAGFFAGAGFFLPAAFFATFFFAVAIAGYPLLEQTEATPKMHALPLL